jgi:hypothetical protein
LRATCTDPLATIDILNLLRETEDVLEGQSSKGRQPPFVFAKENR